MEYHYLLKHLQLHERFHRHQQRLLGRQHFPHSIFQAIELAWPTSVVMWVTTSNPFDSNFAEIVGHFLPQVWSTASGINDAM